MMVLVDTPVWSLALRRKPEQLSPRERQLSETLAELVREGRVQLLGPVRQELLSGIREEAQFRKLRDYLRAFPEQPLEAADYEEAAHMNNRCRTHGIAGSAIDFLICALARITAVTSKQLRFPLLLTVVILPPLVCACAVADYL
jgi:predicted nucleic acid-binding protein